MRKRKIFNDPNEVDLSKTSETVDDKSSFVFIRKEKKRGKSTFNAFDMNLQTKYIDKKKKKGEKEKRNVL